MMKRVTNSVVAALLLLASSCSSNSGSGPAAGSGGRSNGSGGISAGSGGNATGAGGSTTGSGGSTGNGSGGLNGAGGSPSGAGGLPGGGTGGAAMGGAGPAGSAGRAAIGGAPGTGGTVVACAPPIAVTTGTPATVTLNLAGASGETVSPDLMGIHTAVYDGLLTTTPATVTLLKAAGVTSLRYPGGSYADLYHWEANTGTPTPAAGFGANTINIAPTANFGRFVALMQSVGANALITVSYGMNSRGTGPGSPKEAAAWVAYANGAPGDTTVIGPDSSTPPVDFMTVGYWAGLRAAAPLATDDGRNFLRIGQAQPVGIKYWEIGNELYGNGFYNGRGPAGTDMGFAGWEADLHAPYNGMDGSLRRNHPQLAPAIYGSLGVRDFAIAMKAVDPSIKVGGIVNWPDNSYAGWNTNVLAQGCANMDFAVAHWYPGANIPDLLTAPRTGFPPMYAGLRALLTTNCPAGKGVAMPIAVTEWGPNFNTIGNGIYNALIAPGIAGRPPTQTQVVGIFAAESYANFMEQGVISAHWAQLHDAGYLGQQSTDTGWGYHGAVMAHHLAASGDRMLPQPTSTSGALLAHASRRADGSVGVMLTNTSATAAANVTLTVTGGALGCAGTRYTYAPAAGSTDLDGPVTSANIFSSTTGAEVPVAVPAYSVVVVSFPGR